MKKVTRTLALLLTLCTLLSCLSIFVSAGSSIGDISTEQMIIPPTAEQAAAAVAAASYSSAPGHIFPFVYDGTDSIIWSGLDTSDFVTNRLYVHNTNANSVIEITIDPVVAYTCTAENLFYVTSANKIFATDFTGTSHTQLYQSTQGTISNLDYYNGRLTFIEGGVQVKILEISTQTVETVFANKGISSVFFFDNDKFIWRDSVGTPIYYNITSKASVSFNNEHEVNSVVAEYITEVPSDDELAELMANDLNSNDITFPLSEYPATFATYQGYSGYPTALSYFTRNYAGSNQCDGFAKYAFDKYYHINNTGNSPSFVGADQSWYSTTGSATCTGRLDEVDANGLTRIRRIVSSVDAGAFIRFGKIQDDGYCRQQHSGIISTVLDYGFWMYECNNDDECGVFYTFYTFEQIIGKYHCVKYYVDHDLSSTNTPYSATRHKKSCENCVGYTLPKHTSTPTIEFYSNAEHKVTASCCGSITLPHTASAQYTLKNKTSHNISFSCCSGDRLRLHTGTERNFSYNDTQHKVLFTCCSGYVLENHVYEGTYPECLDCGYSPELGYSLRDEVVE